MKNIFSLLLLIPVLVWTEPVGDLDYYWEQREDLKIGFYLGARENAPAGGVELLFPLGQMKIRPSFSITLKDDNDISWYYPACDIYYEFYGSPRTNKRVYLGLGAHGGIPIEDDNQDVSWSLGGQAFIGLDYTLNYSSSLFIELGGQGSRYDIGTEQETHVGFSGSVGMRLNL
ncbi:MAG: hypothetical protein APR63_09900 [Desulfuromonas sp. SDB]|nr:MAG: hypothetical protein APR63_09900 [Desulfuromonas sp. SDB]